MIAQSQTRAQQRVGCSLEVSRDLSDEIQVPAISGRGHQFGSRIPLFQVGLMLHGHNVIDSFKEIPHGFAAGAVVQERRGLDSPPKRFCSCKYQLGDFDDRRRQLYLDLSANLNGSEKRRVFQLIGSIVGDLDYSPEDLGAGDTVHGGSDDANNLVGLAFEAFGALRIPRKEFGSRNGTRPKCLAEGLRQTHNDRGVAAAVFEQAQFGGAQVVEQLGPYPISDQHVRVTASQPG
jgi:hypothetical protein